MPVLLIEHQHARYAELLRQARPDLVVHAGADPHELTRHASECAVWLGQPDLLAELLRQGHRPRWVQSTWAGIKPLLAADLPRDYRLTRAVGIFGQVMAEYVLTYVLAHERRVLARVVSQGMRRWDEEPPQSLAGRRVLIVGAGDIGQRVARFLAPWGMELRGIAREPRALPYFAQVSGLHSLAEQAAWADYLVNLLPDTPAAHDLFDAALFARMRDSAVLINAGRGVAVVDADLVAALEDGQLAGAVIDVCREEPLPSGHPFWRTPGLLLTGHSSAPTAPAAMLELFLANLEKYQADEALPGQVDFARGY